jgi:hypothetical protein
VSKKDFVAMADAIREHNVYNKNLPFSEQHLNTLAAFCREQNPQFNRERWFDYIAGKCGPNGGAK